MALLADSYKAAHFEMYPEAERMVAYGEFRAPYKDLKGTEVSARVRNVTTSRWQTDCSLGPIRGVRHALFDRNVFASSLDSRRYRSVRRTHAHTRTQTRTRSDKENSCLTFSLSAAHFYSTHNAGFTPFPFPEKLFRRMVDENNGYFPVKIQVWMSGDYWLTCCVN